MSEDEHSESEFYYPEETDKENNLSEGNSQEEIQRFLTEQKSFNTVERAI